MSYLTFADSRWLLVGAVLTSVILYAHHTFMRRKKKAALVYGNILLLKEASAKTGFKRRESLLFSLTVLAVASALVALADPHIPLEQAKEGVNVVLILDVSGSMQASDYKPTRLEAAKNSAKILIESLNVKDNVGIIVFSDGATTAAYLTPFKEKALEKLSSVSSGGGRTAIGDGLALGIDMAASIPNKKRVAVLLSDGENNAGVISPEEAVSFAKKNEIQVYTVGIGSNNPIVLGYDFFGNPQYASLDEATLTSIAKETGGEYFRAVDEGTLKQIYEKIPEKIKREREPTSIKNWLIWAAVFFMFAAFYVQYGRHRVIQ